MRVRYKSLYISLPFSAQQQREMTIYSSAYFERERERERLRLIFRIFRWK